MVLGLTILECARNEFVVPPMLLDRTLVVMSPLTAAASAPRENAAAHTDNAIEVASHSHLDTSRDLPCDRAMFFIIGIL
jgi:hypothetical protein